MSPLSRHILLATTGLAAVSGCYYLCLVAGLPFFVFLLAAAALVTGIILWERRAFRRPADAGRLAWFTGLILISGLMLLLLKGWRLMHVYGDWDAMAMWNYHARFLSDPVHWQRLYLTPSMDHPDYPLCLPAAIATGWRLLGSTGVQVPASIALWVLLLLPALIFTEISSRSRLWALVTLWLCCSNTYFIGHAVSQYADTLLSLYFLGALVAMHHFIGSSKPAYLLLCGACLGSAMWTKNEGMLLAAVFLLFYARVVLRSRKGLWLLAGALPMAIALLVHKIGFAPGNDLVAGQGRDSLQLLLSSDRAGLILQHFWDNLYKEQQPLTIGLIVFLAWNLLRYRTARVPADLGMIGLCLLGYLLTYMVTPNDLEWHLGTSMNRVIHQLVPVTIYVLALRLSGSDYPATGKKQPRLTPSEVHPGAYELNS